MSDNRVVVQQAGNRVVVSAPGPQGPAADLTQAVILNPLTGTRNTISSGNVDPLRLVVTDVAAGISIVESITDQVLARMDGVNGFSSPNGVAVTFVQINAAPTGRSYGVYPSNSAAPGFTTLWLPAAGIVSAGSVMAFTLTGIGTWVVPCLTGDARLSDARTPTAHTHSAADVNAGTLAVVRGGTGTGTAFTQHNVVFSGASGVFAQASNFTFNTSTNVFTVTGTSVATTAFTLGTLTYAASNAPATFQNTVNGFTQAVIQNSNAGATASANFIVNNNLSTDTTNFGEFGINSSGFTGSGAYNAPSAVYVAAAGGPLVLGTIGAHTVRVVVNSGSTDAMTIATTGRVGLNSDTPGARLEVLNSTAADIVLKINAASGQSVPIVQVRDVTNVTNYFSIGTTGVVSMSTGLGGGTTTLSIAQSIDCFSISAAASGNIGFSASSLWWNSTAAVSGDAGNAMVAVDSSGSTSRQLRGSSIVVRATKTSSTLSRMRIDGNISCDALGTGFRIAEGSNCKQGTAVLAAGSVVVSNTSVTANSRILVTSNTDGGTPGWLRVSARTAGTSFTITSSSGTDTSTVAFEIFEPA